jgi:glycosyltransferase involved in cell wall biosynthesis
MTILFISSGNSGNISPIVKAQGESLRKFGVSVDYFAIQGKGASGYAKNILKLRKQLKTKKYDVVHAHFVFSAFVATLAGAKPLVVSLMGSDTAKEGMIKKITRFLQKNVWGFTLVKSEKMKVELGVEDILVLPNGVNFEHFRPINREEALAKINWNPEKRYVLFGSSPSRAEKNFDLAQQAFNALNLPNTELKTLENVPFELVPFYYAAADVVLLTSHREGSPNVIKEAMACSRPIVVTPVGDVKKVIVETQHCYIVEPQTAEVANALREILSKPYLSTDGRNQVSWLNQDEIALQLIDIYKGLQR